MSLGLNKLGLQLLGVFWGVETLWTLEEKEGSVYMNQIFLGYSV